VIVACPSANKSLFPMQFSWASYNQIPAFDLAASRGRYFELQELGHVGEGTNDALGVRRLRNIAIVKLICVPVSKDPIVLIKTHRDLKLRPIAPSAESLVRSYRK